MQSASFMSWRGSSGPACAIGAGCITLSLCGFSVNAGIAGRDLILGALMMAAAAVLAVSLASYRSSPDPSVGGDNAAEPEHRPHPERSLEILASSRSEQNTSSSGRVEAAPFVREPYTMEAKALPSTTAIAVASYQSDENYAVIRLCLGVCGAGGPDSLILVDDWRRRVNSELLPANFQLLAAVPRCCPSDTRGYDMAGGEGYTSFDGYGYGHGDQEVAQQQQDVGVLLSILCKIDVDSACEGHGPDGPDGCLKQQLLQRLCGNGTSLPNRVTSALTGRVPDPDADDGLVVTVQADDVLFLEYIFTAAARTWLPLHCMPNDPMCLPPPPPLGAAGTGRYCALEVTLQPCVLVLPSTGPSQGSSDGPLSALLSVCVEEWRSPLLDVWPDEMMTNEPVRLEVHLHSSSHAFSISPPTATSGAGAPEAAGAAFPTAEVASQPTEEAEEAEGRQGRRKSFSDPSWDPESPSAVQHILRTGSVAVHVPARPQPSHAQAGAAGPLPYSGLLVVEVWRGTVLCGVGHAVLVEHEAQIGGWVAEAAALAAALPNTPPELTSPTAPPPPPYAPMPMPNRGGPGACSPAYPDSPRFISQHLAMRGAGGGYSRRRSWDSVSCASTDASHELSSVRAPQPAVARIAQDPRNMLLQDLGLFLVYASAQASDSLSSAFMGLQLRSRLQVHEALVRAGCRVLDAAVESGHAGLAAVLHGRLRGLGCNDKQLLMGGVQRPSGLPLLHLALLSGKRTMACLALEWCNAANGVKGLVKAVTVALPPTAARAAVAPGTFSGPDAGSEYARTVVDPLQVAVPLGLYNEVAQLGFAHGRV